MIFQNDSFERADDNKIEVQFKQDNKTLSFPHNVTPEGLAKGLNSRIRELKKEKMKSSIPIYSAFIFLPPIILIIIGLSIFWALKGFKEK